MLKSMSADAGADDSVSSSSCPSHKHAQHIYTHALNICRNIHKFLNFYAQEPERGLRRPRRRSIPLVGLSTHTHSTYMYTLNVYIHILLQKICLYAQEPER